MDDPRDDDRAARVRHARQVLAGSDLTPPTDPVGFGGAPSGELRYFLMVAGLIVIAALVYLIWGAFPASIVAFLVALLLLAGWFVL